MIRIAGRVLLDMLTVASLLVCVAAGGAWGRSYWRTDHAVFVVGGRSFIVSSADQGISVEWTSRRYFDPSPWESVTARPAASFGDLIRFRHDVDAWAWGTRHSYRWLGFSRTTPFRPFAGGAADGLWFTDVGVPYYFICLMTALLPAARGRRALVCRRRRRRVAAGRCGACGYDRRATPDRCPECGAAQGVAAAEGTAVAAA